MHKFLSIIPSHTTTDLDLNHYEAVSGFLDRDGDKKECAVILDVRISCKSGSARASVVTYAKSLAPNEASSGQWRSSGVLTLMTFSSLDNDSGARIYGRFESREAMEAFVRTEGWLTFWREVRDKVASMESRGYVPNGKGWLHRGDGTGL